jgi:SMC interacting uncharacterized protein involved in chromosome segregation
MKMEETKILERLRSEIEDLEDAIKLYNEFKRLRKILGKPVQTTINPEEIRKDLSSKEFLALIKELKERRHKIGS